MILLRVIPTMNPSSGGPCEGIRNSVRELEKIGVQNEVVSLDDPSATFLNNDTFPIHALGPSRSPWNYSANLLPWLIKNLSRFDAVIVHGLWLYPGYAVRKAFLWLQKQHKLTEKPVRKIPKIYIMPHGMLDPYFQEAPGRNFKAKRNWIYWKLIEGKIVNEAEGVLFTCEEELRLARITFRPYSPKKEINIGYGITAPPTYDESMKQALYQICPQVRSRPYILFLSRIHQKKGVDLLISAYNKVFGSKLVMGKSKKKFSDIPALIIAGPGTDSSYGMELKQRVTKSDVLKTSVFFTGMLTGDAKWGAYYCSQSFILPSHQENFGIAIVEALACNKPVLISRKVNIWKEIEAERGGLIAEDTVEGTVELLEKWYAFSELERRELEHRAGSCYQKHFNIKHVAKQLKEVLS